MVRGWVLQDPIGLYNNLKNKKYKGIINIYTSIVFDIQKKKLGFAMMVVV